jgi:hypothetical protein
MDGSTNRGLMDGGLMDANDPPLPPTREHFDGCAVARLSGAVEAGTIRRPSATRVFHAPGAAQC